MAAMTEPSLHSWIQIEEDSPFSLANIPFGIFSTPINSTPRVGTAIGGHVFDLSAFFDNSELWAEVLNRLQPIDSSSSQLQNGLQLAKDLTTCQPCVYGVKSLNKLAGQGRKSPRVLRGFVQKVFRWKETGGEDGSGLGDDLRKRVEKLLTPMKEVQMHMPFEIGDYTDFYAGLHHAGKLLLSGNFSCLTRNSKLWPTPPRTGQRTPAQLQTHSRRLPRPCQQRRHLRHAHITSIRPNSTPRWSRTDSLCMQEAGL
jgi:fumarylacetoacetase